MRPDTLWSRRAVLGAGVRVIAATTTLTAAALAGCTPEQTPTPDRRTVTSGPTPPSRDADDVSRVVAAIASEERLLDYCTRVERRHPQTRALTRPLQRRQRQHVDALRATLTDEDPAPTRASATAPARAGAALQELRSLLERAQTDRYADCLASASGLLAQQLASLSASHLATLEQLATDR